MPVAISRLCCSAVSLLARRIPVYPGASPILLTAPPITAQAQSARTKPTSQAKRSREVKCSDEVCITDPPRIMCMSYEEGHRQTTPIGKCVGNGDGGNEDGRKGDGGN